MPSDLPPEDAASFFVNPFTAYAILSESRGQPFVHTAAASSLGQMLVKLAAEEGAADRLINVVRSEKQKATLEALGAKHVVLCKDPKTDEAGVDPCVNQSPGCVDAAERRLTSHPRRSRGGDATRFGCPQASTRSKRKSTSSRRRARLTPSRAP